MTTKFIVENIPDALKDRRQWVNWRLLKIKGTEQKISFTPGTNEWAKSNDPTTWRTFDEAVNNLDSYDGLTYATAEDDGVVCIDIDDCRDPDSGEIGDWALEIIRMLDSYTEISPSGAGIRIALSGKKPGGRSQNPLAAPEHLRSVEIYERTHFLSFTGWHLDRTPLTVDDGQDGLVLLYTSIFPDQTEKPTEPPEITADDVERANWAAQLIPDNFMDHWHPWIDVGMILHLYGDELLPYWIEASKRSEGFEDGVCEYFWSTFKPEGKPTLLAIGTLVYWLKEAGAWTPMPEPKVIKVLDTQYLLELLEGPTDIDWLVEPIIPLGAAGMIVGDSNVGKTWLSLELALAVASGTPWLGKFNIRRGPVLVIDEENADVLLRRRLHQLIRGHGYRPEELENITFAIGNLVDLKPIERDGVEQPSESFQKIKNTIDVLRPALVVFDSFRRMHSNDENSSQEMSLIAKYIAMLVRVSGSSVVVNHHTNKSHNYRGSTDIKAFNDYQLRAVKAGRNIRVEHEKSRWDKPVDRFTVEWQAPSEDAVQLVYVGGAAKASDPKDDNWTALRILLERGLRTRKELIPAFRVETGKSETTLDRTIRGAEERGMVTKHDDGREVDIELTIQT